MKDQTQAIDIRSLRYIVVEGPIGVGKTSLARRLATTLDCELVLEQADENPFLKQFYLNRRQAALPTQLYFLLQRARQMEQFRHSDMFAGVRVADYLLEKDRLFAELNLNANELELYNQVAATLELDPPKPDLVIYLQAPAPVLMRRVAARGLPYERSIDQSYLESLGEAYAKFFYDFDDSPLLIVNAASIDPIHRESDYDELLRTIGRVKRGRHFFNPTAGAIA
ncbi:MAG TPA: deoxynucleoside kinase [Gammaproteobacteria bacterium]|nr:deoxynucleoside kinase [Gammaproteobacteria bacterium]